MDEELDDPDSPPLISDAAARLGTAYHAWRRTEDRLERLVELRAPELIIAQVTERRDDALAALRALGWEAGAVRVHHTPYDLDRRPLPSVDHVVRRALVLAALSERALLEEDGATDSITAQQAWARVLDPDFEPDERSLMRAPAGAWSADTTVQMSWLIEGASALAWAMGLAEVGAYDEMCRPSRVKAALGLGAVPATTGKLRARGELIAAYERLFAVHWRLVDYGIHPMTKHFPDLGIRGFWFGPLSVAEIPMVAVRDPAASENGAEEVEDLAIGGHAIAMSTEAARGKCTSIVTERRRALGWLLGLSASYADVPLDT
jgi:hypothetical protein